MTDINEKVKKGLPIDEFLIIDCHCHMGFLYNFNIPENSAEGMLKSMDSLGIDIACVSAHASIAADYSFGNNMIIEAVKKYPERFIGYVVINPNYPENIKNELDRCFASLMIKAIKLHPGLHDCSLEHKNYHTVYEIANIRNYPVLIHVWGSDAVASVDRLASQYPDAQFIMGHAGGPSMDAMQDAINVINKHENVYADTAISLLFEGNLEWFVREVGSKKVLFGTDNPFFDPSANFGRLATAQLEDSEKRDIFGLNMKKLLDNAKV